MEQEKFSLSQEDIGISEAIYEVYPVLPLSEIQATLADKQLRKILLKSIEAPTKTIYTTSKNLLDLLQKNNQREADQKVQKEKKEVKMSIEDIQKATAQMYDFDYIVNKKLEEYLPRILEDLKKIAKANKKTPADMLRVLEYVSDCKTMTEMYQKNWITEIEWISLFMSNMFDGLTKIEKIILPLGITVPELIQKLKITLGDELGKQNI